MIIFFVLLFLSGITLVIYALYLIFTSQDPSLLIENGKSNYQEQETFYRDEKILRLQAQIDSLEKELEKTRAALPNLQTELEAAKEKAADLANELLRRDQWAQSNDEAIKKLQVENLELKNKFIEKERELEGIFTKNVDLNRQLQELNLKLGSLTTQNQEKTDQLEMFKHQIERLKTEAANQAEVIANVQKKEQLSEWVPKEVFKKELEVREEKLKTLVEELVQLKSRIRKEAHFENIPE